MGGGEAGGETPAFAEAAVAATGSGADRRARLWVALPARLGVFERFALPVAEEAELAGMVRLQFEKSLPYPAEEAAFGWQVLSRDGAEMTLMACAVHEEAVNAFCAPLRDCAMPVCLTLWAMHVAAQGPEAGAACGLWREEGKTVFGIFENRRLAYVESLGGDDPLVALPRALIGAEMTGAPTHFGGVYLDPALALDAKAFGTLLGAPVCDWAPPVELPPPGEAVDFVPESWKARQRQCERTRRIRVRLGAVAGLYGAALLASFGWLGFKNRQVDALAREIAALHPSVDGLIERQARWNALAPAVDPQRYLVELLFQTWQCMPTPETRLTRFELAQGQLVIEGEAPDARQAIAFADALKAAPGLGAYRFEAGPPTLLPNEHAQFRIFGKL